MVDNAHTGGGRETDSERERRAAKRHLACFPVSIDDGVHQKRTAVIRDMSATGTLLFTRARLVVGDHVTLSLYLTDDTEHPVLTEGVVLRFEDRDPEQMGIWPFRVAVEFERSLDEHEDAIRRLAAKQAAIGLPHA